MVISLGLGGEDSNIPNVSVLVTDSWHIIQAPPPTPAIALHLWIILISVANWQIFQQ
jgi:hypothetical protein